MPIHCVVFSIGGRDYTLEDFVIAAKTWGDWQVLEKNLRETIVSVKSAKKEGQDAGDEQIELAANEFRYERDLITSDETEAWLEQWELSIEEWMDYLRRTVIRARRAPPANTVEANSIVSNELDLCVHAEAVLSGCVQRVAQKLAGWASVYQKAVEEQRAKPIASSDFITLLQHMEAAYREYRLRTLTPERLAAQVRLCRLEWMRFVCRYMVLSDENMIREAILCLREDRMPPEQVAKNANTIIEDTQIYLEQAGSELSGLLLNARKGDLIGPVRWNDRFALFVLQDKIPPSLDDPQIRRHAEAALLASVVEQEVANRVTWLKRF